MIDHRGFFEELYRKQKSYPTHHRVLPLQPAEYVDFLTQHLARQIGERLEQHAKAEDYESMVKMIADIEKQVIGNPNSFDFPISAVQYWHDEQPLPLLQNGMLLSQPSLITNQGYEVNNFYKTLKYEMLTADRVDFMVSFIRWSGLQLLVRSLDDLRNKGKKVRILTSTYMNVTEPKALSALLEMEHVEVKVFDTGRVSFHTKAYLFARDSEMNTVIIGSSNLSHSALQTGYEWNVKLPSDNYLRIYQRAQQIFNEMWEDSKAISLTAEWIECYKRKYLESRASKSGTSLINSTTEIVNYLITDLNNNPGVQNKLVDSDVVEEKITPNKMQQKALDALKETRKQGHDKGVVIAATGTGKTYLSAFDVIEMGAKRVLFVAHRDELLENARETFVSVMGDHEQFGKLTGQSKDWDRPILFSTIQTLHRNVERFAPDHFDYIVVDEFHHAEAETYRKVLDHFQPQFLLGLTATPERMDGRDVLELCDYNVVFEIRLHEALEKGLLAPFHYFGLSDTVDYDQLDVLGGQFVETSLVQALNTHERVEYIISMINKFGHDGEHRRALGFCVNIEHARYMAEEFTLRGLESVYLTGQNDPETRQSMIQRLEDENDPLEFIFTVNIFNEGVDIPALNLVLFLRPTESATIFIQQLGRGLRKAKDKEFVTILDFIGNYQKSFIVPLALSGQTNHKAFDRDALRATVENDFAQVPDGCFVDLEEISRQKILEKVAEVRMDAKQMLTDLYQNFRRELGKSPEIEDFLYSPNAPSLHYFIKKYGSWVDTKKMMRDLNEFDQRLLSSELEVEIVRRLENALPLKWPYEFAVLYVAIRSKKIGVAEVLESLRNRFSIEITASEHQEHIHRAMQRLSMSYKKQKWTFGEYDEEEKTFMIDDIIQNVWQHSWITKYLEVRLEFGFKEFQRTHRPDVFFKGEERVVLYQNYSRKDLYYLFKATVSEDAWREGVSVVDNNYLLFITLIKGDDVEDRIKYHDYFMSRSDFHWQSRNDTSHASSRGQNYIKHKEKGLNIHLFVRKYKKRFGDTLPFMYLGKVDYVRSHGDKPMNIIWKLQNPLPDEVYLDFVR